LDTEDGINLKGTVTHSENNSHYYGMGNSRTFYIEEVLYTAADLFLKMNFINNLEEINSIKLENTGKFINYLEN